MEVIDPCSSQTSETTLPPALFWSNTPSNAKDQPRNQSILVDRALHDFTQISFQIFLPVPTPNPATAQGPRGRRASNTPRAPSRTQSPTPPTAARDARRASDIRGSSRSSRSSGRSDSPCSRARWLAARNHHRQSPPAAALIPGVPSEQRGSHRSSVAAVVPPVHR